jgi:chitin synthase
VPDPGDNEDRLTQQIVMTMYNEDDILFLRTLNAVIKNIAHLTTRNRSKTWGPESWQKVVVCIVADGRKVIDSRVLKILQLMGVYAEVSSTYRGSSGW